MHFRTAFAKHFHGLDAAVAPFVSTVSASRITPKLFRDLLPENNSGLPVIPQVMSKSAEDFIRMNKVLYRLGYKEVNWNLGCPFKPVRNKKRGSGLLPHPGLVDDILACVCTESPCKISVKVRLGVRDSSELETLVPILNRHPLSEVIIHPRTAVQMYSGHVDIDTFEKIYRQIEHPVCYNGDISDLAFFRPLRKRFPDLDRFMIGRGLLKNPFLCEIIKSGNPHIENAIPRIQAFHADLLSRYRATLNGDQTVLGKMKEFWSFLSISLSNGRKLFKKIKRTRRLDTYNDIINEFLAQAEWL